MSWKKDGYVVVKKALSPDLCKVIARQFRMIRETQFYDAGKSLKRNKHAFGDAQSPNSFGCYGTITLEGLQDSVVKEMVEKHVGIEVLPAFSYGRIYYEGAELKAHTDRSSCEISITACIDSDGTKWPICLKNRKGESVSIFQKPGDVLIYSGCELEHWRKPYTGEEHIQVFCHFIDSQGKYKRFKYDTRPMLGLSPTTQKRWRKKHG